MIIQPANRLSDVQEYYFSKKLKEIRELNASGKNITPSWHTYYCVGQVLMQHIMSGGAQDIGPLIWPNPNSTSI